MPWGKYKRSIKLFYIDNILDHKNSWYSFEFASPYETYVTKIFWTKPGYQKN